MRSKQIGRDRGCLLCRTCFQFYRRSQAVKDLPGPKYPWLLGFFDLLTRRDVHRYATELAERYGPIFKFRIICFHVRAYPMLHGRGRGAGELRQMHACACGRTLPHCYYWHSRVWES